GRRAGSPGCRRMNHEPAFAESSPSPCRCLLVAPCSGDATPPQPVGLRTGTVGEPMYPHDPMATAHRSDTLARERAHELVRSWEGRPGALGSLLGRVSSVDQAGVEERVDGLKTRSIKRASKLWALDLAHP